MNSAADPCDLSHLLVPISLLATVSPLLEFKAKDLRFDEVEKFVRGPFDAEWLCYRNLKQGAPVMKCIREKTNWTPWC